MLRTTEYCVLTPTIYLYLRFSGFVDSEGVAFMWLESHL